MDPFRTQRRINRGTEAARQMGCLTGSDAPSWCAFWLTWVTSMVIGSSVGGPFGFVVGLVGGFFLGLGAANVVHTCETN